MLDVPAILASRIRVLATGRSNKNDPNDAHDTTGLAHVAFKVGGSALEFGLARRLFDASETRVLYEAERGCSRSMHVLDPDGNEIELYVDISD